MTTSGGPVIVVPDTHGHLREVDAYVQFFRREGYLKDHRLVFLGDYLDRGPEVRGLVDRCIALTQEGHIFLMGNHEHTLLMALIEHPAREEWIRRWAHRYEDRTLKSYGLVAPNSFDEEGWRQVADEFRETLSGAHWNFLASLPFIYEDRRLVAVHAGLTLEEPWERQREMLKDRITDGARGPPQLFSPQLARDLRHPAPKLLVTGHAIVARPIQAKRRLMLHCGVDLGGPLMAWVSDTDQLFQVGPSKQTFSRAAS